MNAQSRQPKTPAEARDFREVSKYQKWWSISINLTNPQTSLLLKKSRIGKGARPVHAQISNSDFGEDKGKIRVLIHTQQHGNEQSGKEGALLLVKN